MYAREKQQVKTGVKGSLCAWTCLGLPQKRKDLSSALHIRAQKPRTISEQIFSEKNQIAIGVF